MVASLCSALLARAGIGVADAGWYCQPWVVIDPRRPRTWFALLTAVLALVAAVFLLVGADHGSLLAPWLVILLLLGASASGLILIILSRRER